MLRIGFGIPVVGAGELGRPFGFDGGGVADILRASCRSVRARRAARRAIEAAGLVMGWKSLSRAGSVCSIVCGCGEQGSFWVCVSLDRRSVALLVGEEQRRLLVMLDGEVMPGVAGCVGALVRSPGSVADVLAAQGVA